MKRKNCHPPDFGTKLQRKPVWVSQKDSQLKKNLSWLEDRTQDQCLFGVVTLLSGITMRLADYRDREFVVSVLWVFFSL